MICILKKIIERLMMKIWEVIKEIEESGARNINELAEAKEKG